MWQDGWVKGKSSQSRASRRHRTPEEKTEILSEYQRSGLSLLAFAGKYELHTPTIARVMPMDFGRWNRFSATNVKGVNP